MRRFAAIVKATALEVMSEPLSLLILTAALVLAVFAPALHYHQFGESTRMARDAGLSALLIGGLAFGVSAAVRSVRREFESGTVTAALAHSLSRGMFFSAKCCGVFAAVIVFSLTVFATTLTIVNGAKIGGVIASKNLDIAKLYGPSYAIGVATVVLPFFIGAAAHRFLSRRFGLSAFFSAFIIAIGGACFRPDLPTISRILPVALLVLAPLAFFVTVSAAFAVRFRTNAVLVVVAVAAIAFLPFLGNYAMSDALAKGGTVSWCYCLAAIGIMVPAVIGAGFVGIGFFNGRDIV